MASVLVVFLLLLIPAADIEAQTELSNLINPASYLSPNTDFNSSWLSPSRLFAFGFYPQGNGFSVGIWIVGQPENTVVWTANRDDSTVSSNSTVEFTGDGKLILLTETRTEHPIADIRQSATSASMLDSGNFVLYSNNSTVIWESFAFPTDTILATQNLSRGHELVSSASSSDRSSGRFSLSMQTDGNLVAYPVNSARLSDDSYWYTATFGKTYTQLSLNNGGRLSLLTPGSVELALVNGSSVSENGTVIFRATLDSDGIFRLYSHRFESNTSSIVSIEWSALQDRCEVLGFCGFNSYCSNKTGEASCNCYPGYVFVDPDNEFRGCYMNFSEARCRNNGDLTSSYEVSLLENVTWGDYPYYVQSTAKQDCGESCVEDCNCGAALYVNGYCRKFKLPLRYGTLNLSNLATAFVKIRLGTAGIADQSRDDPSNQTVVTDDKKELIAILAGSLGSIACLCLAVAIFSFFMYRNRAHRYKKLSDNANLAQFEDFTLRSFSYEELEKATDGFKEELGKGSNGTIYKGILSGSNRTVAVKRLEKVLEEGERKFQSEMTSIGRTHHRNLVRLLGFCVEGSRKLLVYDYMSNGSLAELLFKAERHPGWRERVRIALDVARGLLYLHEECETCIVHCGIKPRNILMDDSWTAKISDFGLAKLVVPNQTEMIAGTGETGGYLAPERQQEALSSVKADIYSFGVVLMEIICCRRNIEVNVRTADEIILSAWAYKCFVGGELGKLVEDEGGVDTRMLERMVKVGLWCVQDYPSLRPSMKNVITMLEGKKDIPTPPPPSPSLLDPK